jgi:hypothetical protein
VLEVDLNISTGDIDLSQIFGEEIRFMVRFGF